MIAIIMRKVYYPLATALGGGIVMQPFSGGWVSERVCAWVGACVRHALHFEHDSD